MRAILLLILLSALLPARAAGAPAASQSPPAAVHLPTAVVQMPPAVVQVPPPAVVHLPPPAGGASVHRNGVRVGQHGVFGRVVFLVPHAVVGQVTMQDDSTLRVSLPGAGVVPGSVRGTRNVLAVDGGTDGAVLVVAPGSRPVLWQSDGRVVIDVYPAAAPGKAVAIGRGIGAAHAGVPPPVTPTPMPLARPAPMPPRPDAARASAPPKSDPVRPPPAPDAPPPVRLAAGPAAAAPASDTAMHAAADTAMHAAAAAGPPGVAAPVAAVTPSAPAPVGDAAPAPAAPASAQAAPDSPPADGLVAARVAPEQAGSREGGGDAILVPFDREVGAAAFARSGLAHVIFDESKPVDLAQLKDDPVFGSARVTLLPAATHLALRLAPGRSLSLRRRPDGWLVAVVPHEAAAEAAPIRMQDRVVDIGTPHPADTVVMDDPATGGRLLVGTVLAEGPGVSVPHASPDFTLLPSWTGVLVAAQSDRLALRAAKTSFSLGTATGAPVAAVIAAEAEQALASAGTLTRRFDLTSLPIAVRRERLTGELAAAAKAPKLGRFKARARAAQDMVALGLDREAAAMLRLAMQDDPVHAGDADANGLLAIADWMAGRGDGAALMAPALGNSDELALWRAVLWPGTDGKAAASLAGTWRLLLAYPAPLQRGLMPKVADIMLKGGQRAAAEAMLAKVPGETLDSVRAASLAMDGKNDAALALLDRLSLGHDRKQAAAARRDAVELRLATGKLTPGAAAAALDQHLYAWRDDALEADQRLRIAGLRSKAGDWRRALALLRETEAIKPDAHDRVHAVERQVIGDLLASSAAATLAPLDLVALVEENADLLAEKGASETLAPVLVDKLLALDLPDRADPILRKLITATDAPEAKAGLGARLAALRLDQGDAAGAKAALADSDEAGLSAPLMAHRTVLQARGLVLEGADDAALKLLVGQDGPEALELQARLLEKRKDWRGAETMLRKLADASLPPQGGLTDAQQDLVLRLASAASEAGDNAAIQRLQDGDARRLAAGPRSELFQALATRPVQALADLPRSAREAEAARAVPAALASYDTH